MFIYFLFSIILILTICSLLYLYIKEKNKSYDIIKINKEKELQNQKIEQTNQYLIIEKDKIQQEINNKNKELNDAQMRLDNMEDISKKSYQRYVENLEELYNNQEKEYDDLIIKLHDSYEKQQDKMLAEMETVQNDLDKIISTRSAAIQALLREEEIKNQKEFYSLNISSIDLKEVKLLHSIESELRDPRPVRMIIWTSYYSKKANELCSRVLGINKVTGIYKITNLNTNMCYIGQAKDIKERWREHMKCGLGIDAPVNNKLYQAMQKEGLDIFTFELLEECTTDQLNEKEAFYINLYNSYDFGFNSNKGVKNK